MDELENYYRICFKNSTEIPYHFGVYQTFPKSPGLDSKAWKHVGVPPFGQASIEWEMKYGIAIKDWGCDASTQLIENAQLGKVYQITTVDVDIPKISLTQEATDDDKIEVRNCTHLAKTVGFVLDGDILTEQRKVDKGEIVLFKLHPAASHQFYVACHHSMQVGCVVDSSRYLDPVIVKHVHGSTSCTVEVAKENEELILKVKAVNFDDIYD